MIALVAAWLLPRVPAWLVKPLAIIVGVALMLLGARIWYGHKIGEAEQRAKLAEEERQRASWAANKSRSDAAAAAVDGMSDADIRRELHQRHGTTAAKPGDPV